MSDTFTWLFMRGGSEKRNEDSEGFDLVSQRGAKYKAIIVL